MAKAHIALALSWILAGSNWARRLAAQDGKPALLPLAIKQGASVAPAVSLRSPSGWTVPLPPELPTMWLAELLRSLA